MKYAVTEEIATIENATIDFDLYKMVEEEIDTTWRAIDVKMHLILPVDGNIDSEDPNSRADFSVQFLMPSHGDGPETTMGDFEARVWERLTAIAEAISKAVAASPRDSGL